MAPELSPGFLGIHTILWNKKSVVKCFKCYSEKSLHNFVNRLEIGATIIHVIHLMCFVCGNNEGVTAGIIERAIIPV